MTKISEIKGLVDHLNRALKDSELTEARVTIEGLEILLKREPAPVTVTAAAMPAYPAPAALAAAPLPAAAGGIASAGPAAAADSAAKPAAGDVIKSPMVGTCYLSPEPGRPPFVKVGDSVAKGDTLVIIEAMKVMNTLEAPRDGKIVDVLIADASPIEFDQPLFVIA